MNKIRLPRDGAEYAHFIFSPANFDAGVVLEAQIGDGAWTPLDRSSEVPRLLLRGPNSGTTSGVLVSKDASIRVRVKSAPEVVIRGAGYVALVS